MKIYDTQHNSEARELDICPTLLARMGTGGNMVPIVLSHPQGAAAPSSEPVIAIQGNVIGRKPENGGNGLGVCEEIAPTLTATDHHGVAQGLAVRRLTPVECERLQGMPDNWTRISWKGKPPEECPDAPRYKAIGNSWAVPVIQWIGKRILSEEAAWT